MPGDILVSVPARPEFLHVLRSVVASVAARADFPYDAIEDLRIAVDEACAQLLSRSPDAEELRIRVRPLSGGIELEASTEAPEGWTPADVRASLAWQVIEALADEAAVVTDGGWAAVRIAMTVPGASP